MQWLRLRLRPLSAFGTVPIGDTLFGQLCWAIRHREGEPRLVELLSGYTSGKPFAVVSDLLPAGFVPRPPLLSRWGVSIDPEQRKRLKRARWMPSAALSDGPKGWVRLALEALDNQAVSELSARPQQHNTLNRLTGTTGTGEFAPYTVEQLWYPSGTELDCHLVFDPERISAEAIGALLGDIGASGFGRDASIGLGRFLVTDEVQEEPNSAPDANAALTLAPCAPQGLDLDVERSCYQVFTRFGRHGDQAVQSGRPFKAPLLLARTGALFAAADGPPRPWVGQGLGGDGSISRAIPATVHQGYAPTLGVRLPLEEEAR